MEPIPLNLYVKMLPFVTSMSLVEMTKAFALEIQLYLMVQELQAMFGAIMFKMVLPSPQLPHKPTLLLELMPTDVSERIK